MLRSSRKRKILGTALKVGAYPAIVGAAYAGSRIKVPINASEAINEKARQFAVDQTIHAPHGHPSYVSGCMPSPDRNAIVCGDDGWTLAQSRNFTLITLIGTAAVIEALNFGTYYHDKRLIESSIRNRILKKHPGLDTKTVDIAVKKSYPLYKKLRDQKLSEEKLLRLRNEIMLKKAKGKRERFLKSKIWLSTHPIPDKPYWHLMSGHVI
jgi:hypothetical protein